MKEKDYPLEFSPEDKVRIFFRQNRGEIDHFIIQYYAKLDGKWRTIMRIDTCHGFAHLHVFHANGKERVVRLPGDLNSVFTERRDMVMNNFIKIKENYLYH